MRLLSSNLIDQLRSAGCETLVVLCAFLVGVGSLGKTCYQDLFADFVEQNSIGTCNRRNSAMLPEGKKEN
jgi:hypothetical protein